MHNFLMAPSIQYFIVALTSVFFLVDPFAALPAFEIAGGIILILMGLEMLQARRSATHETPGETQEGVTKEDAGIIPLGTPMLAGPGAISTVMVLMGPSPNWWHVAIVLIAITITVLASFLILSAAERVRHFLGETGIRILMRLMGLLLTAIAVQFIVNGLADLGVVHKQ